MWSLVTKAPLWQKLGLLGLGLVLLALPALSNTTDYINQELFDETLQMYRSGAKTPREYYIPPVPSYEKHDPHEFEDYYKTHYAPYAQLQLYRALQAGDKRLEAGYYMVKLDVVPPPPEPLKPLPQNPVLKKMVELQRQYFPKKPPGYRPAQRIKKLPEVPPNPETPPEKQFKGQVSMILKRMGEMELVIPIAKTDYQEKSLKRGKTTASLKLDSGSPLSPQIVYITYCVRQICYQSVAIAPGLVQ